MQQNTDATRDCVTIIYTGVILDEESRARLLSAVREQVPPHWLIKAHHMTLNLGHLDAALNPGLSLGERAAIEAVAVGINEKVIAVKVRTTLQTFNGNPHVTVACDYDGGGRPRDSNDLQVWTPLTEPILLYGSVQTEE